MRALIARLTILLLAISPSLAVSQTTQSLPHFDVATIRPSEPQPPGRNNSNIRRLPGGRFSTVNARLKALVQLAYRVQDFHVSGGPAWIDSEGFDIVAIPDREIVIENLTPDAMPRMLQMLLEDRFQLKVHRETRDMAVYALVVG